MLTLGTHKIYKITSLTVDSYKQLFVLIAMLLTVLSVQQSTFALAAPLQQQSSSSSSSSLSSSLWLEQSRVQQQHNSLTHASQQSQSQQPMLHLNYQHQQPPMNNEHQVHPNIQFDFLLAENDHNNHHDRPHRHDHQQEELETDQETEERLHKRHTSWHDYYFKTMESTKIEWYNPCGGQYVEVPKKSKPKPKPAVKKALRILQNSTVRGYYSLDVNHLYAIDIRNMSMWDKFDEDYKFLPNIKANSRISLRRWYRQMQIYVASFDYLQRAQLHWDYNEGMQQSETSRELYVLRNSARDILCNIEIAINNTTGNSKTKATINSLFIPRKRMESLLHFYTNLKSISSLKWQQMKYDKNVNYINPVDLRFAKSHYVRYLRKFIKFLRVTTKRPGRVYLKHQGDKQPSSPSPPPPPKQQNKQRKAKKNNRKELKNELN